MVPLEWKLVTRAILAAKDVNHPMMGVTGLLLSSRGVDLLQKKRKRDGGGKTSN